MIYYFLQLCFYKWSYINIFEEFQIPVHERKNGWGSVFFCEEPLLVFCLLPEEISVDGGIILSLTQVKLLC